MVLNSYLGIIIELLEKKTQSTHDLLKTRNNEQFVFEKNVMTYADLTIFMLQLFA